MPLTGSVAAEISGNLQVPQRDGARIKSCDLQAGSRGQEKVTFSSDLPLDLGSAIALEGELGVFRRVINSLVIEKQGEKRRELEAKEEGAGRTRAGYLTELGL